MAYQMHNITPDEVLSKTRNVKMFMYASDLLVNEQKAEEREAIAKLNKNNNNAPKRGRGRKR